MVVKVATAAIIKLICYKNGALFLINGTLSAGIVYYFNELIKDSNPKNLVLPVIIFIFGFIVYNIFTLIDLITGLMNARYQNSLLLIPEKNYIKHYRLWFTVWKNLGITTFAFMVMGTCILAETVKQGGWFGESIYSICIWILITTWLMASAFEFHSIGDNIQRRTGSKPAFFKLISKLTDIAQDKIILKAKGSFDAIEPDITQIELMEKTNNNEKNS